MTPHDYDFSQEMEKLAEESRRFVAAGDHLKARECSSRRAALEETRGIVLMESREYSRAAQILADAGFHYVLAGDTGRGLQLIDQAVTIAYQKGQAFSFRRSTNDIVATCIEIAQTNIDLRNDAFMILYNLMKSRVHWACRIYFGDVNLVDDAIQQTFLKALTNITECRRPASFSGWLVTTARRVCLDMIRTNKRLNKRNHQVARPESLTEDPLMDLSFQETLGIAKANLTPDELLVVSLHCEEELTFVEISELMESTPAATRALWDSALKKLRELL